MEQPELRVGGTDLGQKAWYRLLKVVYFAAYILALSVIGSFAYTLRPTQVVDYEHSTISCSSGDAYPLRRVSDPCRSKEDFSEGSRCDDVTRVLCAYGQGTEALGKAIKEKYPQYAYLSDADLGKLVLGKFLKGVFTDFLFLQQLDNPVPIPGEKNYAIEFTYETRGGWDVAIRGTLRGIALILVVFELLRRTFLYVVVGRRFFTKGH